MQLSTWNPFKFGRKQTKQEEATKPKTDKEKQITKSTATEAAAAPQPATALAPMFASNWMRNFFSTPLWMDPWLREDPFFTTNELDRWFGDFSATMFRPSIDVTDEGKALKITAELPGMEEKDVKVTVDDGALTIAGEKRVESKVEKDDCYHVERSYGSFRRVLPLPSDVDMTRIEAKMDKGVLTVRVPKSDKPAEKAKTIPIATST